MNKSVSRLTNRRTTSDLDYDGPVTTRIINSLLNRSNAIMHVNSMFEVSWASQCCKIKLLSVTCKYKNPTTLASKYPS